MKAPCLRRKGILLTLLVGVISFVLGRMAALSGCLFRNSWVTLQTNHHPSLPSTDRPSPWQHQIQDHDRFQAWIHYVQNQCVVNNNNNNKKPRYLIRDKIPLKDGFASEVQYMARLLQVAMSTDRILWIADSWESAYCPHDERGGGGGGGGGGGWTCLWQPITNCTARSTTGTTKNPRNRTLLDTTINPLTYGILAQRQRSDETSAWFDPLLYSSRAILPAPKSFPLKHSALVADVIPHWERAYGRYWIRSQMSHFLWKPAKWLSQEIKERMVYPKGKPFIGIHVRFTDNIPDFAKGFGRNATYTRQLQHFWDIAQILANQHYHETGMILRDIYIATDHELVLAWARNLFVGWNIWGQENDVQRSTSQSRIWFAEGRSSAAGAMAADLEVLRRADYLIGSFQSNVYRLAAQLNTAWHVHQYSVRKLRHFTVDVEWFEDP